MKKTDIPSRAPTWAIRAVGVVSFLVLLVLAFFLRGLVALLVVGALVAYLLDPAVQFVERRGFSRLVSAIVVFASLMLLVLASMLVLVPAVVTQLQGLLTLDISSTTDTFESVNAEINSWFDRLGIRDVDLLASLLAYLGDRIPGIISIIPDALSFLGNLLLFPFIVFFLLKDGRELKKGVLGLVPNRYFEFSLGLLFKMDLQLGNWLRGQFIEAMVVGVLSIAALWILDIPYFLPVGLFAGAANIIPYLGPFAGAITAIIVVVLSGGSTVTAALIVILFMLIQMLDNTIVQPLVISRNVKMHPLLIVVSVVAGGQLFGLLGLLLAVPVVAILKVFVVESVAYLRRYQFMTS